MDDPNLQSNVNILMQSGLSIGENSQKELTELQLHTAMAGANITIDTSLLGDRSISPKPKNLALPVSGVNDDGSNGVPMTTVPISALAPGKLGLQLGDLENVTLFNTSDGQALELQAFPGGAQALQGIQTVKLTLINCGDQQTILLTTPSTQILGSDQGEGVTLAIPDNIFGSDLSLSGLTNPVNSVSMGNHVENEHLNAPKLISYANLTALPPIASVSERLYNHQSQISNSIELGPSEMHRQPGYAIQDLKPVVQQNGEKVNGSLDNCDKSLPDVGIHPPQSVQAISDFNSSSVAPMSGDGLPPGATFAPCNEVKTLKSLDLGKSPDLVDNFALDLENIPSSPQESIPEGDRGRGSTPPCEIEELNTKVLRFFISDA
ncbi:unnamed protein product [Protopolystoma xenopodis]|uniref:Uncharacterized protein n=1 Tax=Protopolystoma xenopodis TaxID=117903 RepID=A0A448WR11_9PLAT|nr:unnamed protein product [Protopolystoma xenopodis]